MRSPEEYVDLAEFQLGVSEKLLAEAKGAVSTSVTTMHATAANACAARAAAYATLAAVAIELRQGR